MRRLVGGVVGLAAFAAVLASGAAGGAPARWTLLAAGGAMAAGFAAGWLVFGTAGLLVAGESAGPAPPGSDPPPAPKPPAERP